MNTRAERTLASKPSGRTRAGPGWRHGHHAAAASDLTAADFGGAPLEGCNENLVRTRPDVVSRHPPRLFRRRRGHRRNQYVRWPPSVLAEYGLDRNAYAESGRRHDWRGRRRTNFPPPAKPRFVAGSMGPTTKAISVTGGVTFPDLVGQFHEQARALLDGGVDLLLVETCHDTRNVKAACWRSSGCGASAASASPSMVSGTIEAMGTMLAGQTADAFCASLSHTPTCCPSA